MKKQLSKKRSSVEVNRKLAHFSSGIVAAAIPVFTNFIVLYIVAALFFVAMIIVRRYQIFKSLSQLDRTSFGELFFPIGITITALIFSHDVAFYVYGVLILTFADGLAGLIGAEFGKRKFTILNRHKSYLGSSVFFIVSLLLGLFFAPHHFIILIVGALFLTLVELLSSKGVDNIFLPPLAAAVMLFAV